MTALSPAARLVAAADRIESLADAATPGPWVRSGCSIETDHECSPRHDCWPVADTYSGMKPDGSTAPRELMRADAAHIAASDPQTMRLVAALLRAVAACADGGNRSYLLTIDALGRALVLADHYLERNDQ